MCRISNFIFSILNVVLILLAVVSIGVSCYLLAFGHESACQRFFQEPLLILGLFLFVMATIGLIGSCFGITFVLWIYSFVTFFLVLGLICLTIFVFIVTNKGASRALAQLGYEEYRLGDYSSWLQKNFVNGKNWDEIKSCLIDANVCDSLRNNGVDRNIQDFYKRKLSSIQYGCCKPPMYCGFEYKNATFWEVPPSGPAVSDPDCMAWNNDLSKLCYDCNSCKGGVLDNIRKDWRMLAKINVCVVGFIVLIYSTSCCARRDIRSHSRRKIYRG